MSDKLYKAKINGLYVKNASEFFKEISLTPDRKKAQYLKEKEKDYLLKHLPTAEIKSYSIIDDDDF